MRLPGTIRLMSVMVESSASVALPLLLIAVRPHNTRNDARTSGQFKDKGGTLFREQQDSMNASIGNARDRKSTRLNSKSLMRISYAVFCLKKKKNKHNT